MKFMHASNEFKTMKKMWHNYSIILASSRLLMSFTCEIIIFNLFGMTIFYYRIGSLNKISKNSKISLMNSLRREKYIDNIPWLWVVCFTYYERYLTITLKWVETLINSCTRIYAHKKVIIIIHMLCYL